MFNRHTTIFSKLLPALVGLTLMLGAAGARAAIEITPHDVSGAPGSTVGVTFDFDFGASSLISNFGLNLTFDPARLTLLDGFVTSSGVPVDAETLLAANGIFLPYYDLPAGSVNALWYYNQTPDSQWFELSGIYTLQLNFQLNNDFPVGGASQVVLDYDWSGDGVDAASLSKTANVAAVPLPPALLLMLSGLGMMAASRVRRLA